MALIPWIIMVYLSPMTVGRLVVDNKEELMILDMEGKKSLDLMRIVREGDKVRATVTESDCPGVMEESAEYEYVTINEGEEEKHSVETILELFSPGRPVLNKHPTIRTLEFSFH